MLELVTVEQARAHLRLDADSQGGADDAWLALFIPSVSAAVAAWLRDDWRLYLLEVDSEGEAVYDSQGEGVNLLDSQGERVLHPAAQAAVLIELDRLYRFRDGGDGTAEVPADAGYGYVVGRGATMLLTPLRCPVIA